MNFGHSSVFYWPHQKEILVQCLFKILYLSAYEIHEMLDIGMQHFAHTYTQKIHKQGMTTIISSSLVYTSFTALQRTAMDLFKSKCQCLLKAKFR